MMRFKDFNRGWHRSEKIFQEPSSGIVCEIVDWKLIGEGGRELADFGLVTIIFTYSPHRIIRILQSPVGVHKEKRDHEKILHRSPPPPLPLR